MANHVDATGGEPALEEAFVQFRGQSDDIYTFCERSDLMKTIEKANSSTTAKDIYLQAYERAVATLEASTIRRDIGSEHDAAMGILNELRVELPGC